jgi:hypothetical protein
MNIVPCLENLPSWSKLELNQVGMASQKNEFFEEFKQTM